MSYKLYFECCLSETYKDVNFYGRVLAHKKILPFGRKYRKHVQNVLHGTKAMVAKDFVVLILA